MDATTATRAREEHIEKLRELIRGIRIAMLTTEEEDGTLHSRPMATQRQEFDGTLWFFTRKDSAKVYEIERDRHVNVAYAPPEENRYVSVAGHARLVEDREKIEKLWHSDLKAFFPEGKDDPQIALLKIDVARAQYWTSPSGAVVKLVGLAKALAKGTSFQEEVGENEKLQM